MSKSVADQLVEMLVAAGVKRVFAITGDSLNPVNDAIRRSGELEWIHVRHEEVAAYAASMDAELNGIGCCMGSSGPGHVHLINGLYDANRSGNPVIAIASTCPTERFGQDYFQETNLYHLFQDCSKYLQVANTAKQFPHMMQSALQTAVSQRGVSVIGVPGDVAAQPAIDVSTSINCYQPAVIYRPTDSEIEKLAKLINDNTKVTLYCGHGAQYAVKDIQALAEKINAPICYTFRGKIFFDREDNPNRAGLNGLLGYQSGFDACNDCDLLILLGCDFPYTQFLPKHVKIAQIEIKPERIGRRAKVDLGLVGDVEQTVSALLPRVIEKSDDLFLKVIQQRFKDSEAGFHHYVTRSGKKKNIQPEYVAYLVSEMASDDAIFTVDTGMTSVWAARFIQQKRDRYLTGSFSHGSMANAMPMAIGAACSTNRQVVSLCGDGGLSMLMGDLATIMQYELPIKMIVFNNRSLGMVKLEMEVEGLTDWQTNMVNPPFDKVAELMNIKGFNVEEPEELQSALEQAFKHPGPVLVNVHTTANALSLPPHTDLKQLRGFMVSMMKKMAQGDVEDVISTAQHNVHHLKDFF